MTGRGRPSAVALAAGATTTNVAAVASPATTSGAAATSPATTRLARAGPATTSATPGAPAKEAGAARRRGRPLDEEASRAILAAALRQLDQLGYGRMTVESVAVEAGVSRASVYRRFRDKADLVTAAIAETGGTHDEHAGDDPREALVAFLEGFDGRFAESCLEVIGGLVGAREDPGALALHRQRVVAPRRAYARSLLETARDRGDLAADADLDLALEMLAGSVLFRRVSGEAGRRGWAGRAVEAVWTGMAPGTGASREAEVAAPRGGPPPRGGR